MALSKKDKQVLQEIVDLDGNCLDGRPRCEQCPFRAKCLPEFLNKERPTKHKRLEMAKRVLFHNIVLEGEDEDQDS